jgi:universal stress protein A
MKTQTTKRPAPRTSRATAKMPAKAPRRTPDLALRVILVPVDFSPRSLQALDLAVALAKRFDASIKLLHVLDPLHAPGRFDAPRLRSLRGDSLRDAKLKLAKLAKRHVKAHVAVRHRVLDGIAYAVIIEAAAKAKADMIVMGTEGRTGMSRFLVGSVAEKVIRHARCPVLIVRNKRR